MEPWFLGMDESATILKPGARDPGNHMWSTTLNSHAQTNAEDSISSNSCGLHWIIDPLQTMIVIACWISCYPDSIAVDLPPEFLTASSPTMMSASWRSFFPSTWPWFQWFRKNLWGMCCAWTWVKYRKPWLLRIRKKKNNQKSQVPFETKTLQKTMKMVASSSHFWFTHFSKRLGLHSSDDDAIPMCQGGCHVMLCQVPLVNRTGPSPQPNKHRCGMLWVIPRAPKFCGCFMICASKNIGVIPQSSFFFVKRTYGFVWKCWVYSQL